MTEILTESFCERCGTRYTFESARPKTRLKGVKVLSRGLKNFVLSDDTSIDEAMAAARSETDREATSHQLDAFHETFNFCMSCRQYTCPNCWNESEVRCLSCAPLAVPETPVAFDDLTSLRAADPVGEPTPGNGTGHHVHAAESIEVAVESIEVQADVAPSSPATSQAPSATDSADPAGKAVDQTASLLRRFRPGQSLDAEVEAFERQRTDAEARDVEPDLEPLSAETVGATPIRPAPADLMAATTEPAAVEPSEPSVGRTPTGETATAADERIAAGPELATEADPQAAGPADIVEQPTWRITAPDGPGAAPAGRPGEDNGAVPLQAGKSPNQVPATPRWPAQPEWPTATSTSAPGLPFLGRPAMPQGGIDALWAASNQELAAAAPTPGRPAANGIQPCVSCGLSLSANARFCRRCGTVQGR